jgi:hypothetical protein
MSSVALGFADPEIHSCFSLRTRASTTDMYLGDYPVIDQDSRGRVSVRNSASSRLFSRGKMEDVKRTRPMLISFLFVSLLLHGTLLLALPENDTGYFQWVCNGAEFAVTRIQAVLAIKSF